MPLFSVSYAFGILQAPISRAGSFVALRKLLQCGDVDALSSVSVCSGEASYGSSCAVGFLFFYVYDSNAFTL